MRAEKVILTHFSQRYPKLPNLGKSIILGFELIWVVILVLGAKGWESKSVDASSDQAGKQRIRVVIAFDFLRVEILDLFVLAIHKMFNVSASCSRSRFRLQNGPRSCCLVSIAFSQKKQRQNPAEIKAQGFAVNTVPPKETEK